MTTNAGAVNHREEFRRGLREIVEPSFGISAWALVTGVAMIKSGLSVPLATLMSLAVYAGSAQLAALPLMAAGAPLWVVWAAAFCMNLRFVIFSAHWRKYFGHFPRAKRLALTYVAADLNYVLFVRRFPDPKPSPEQVSYYLGSVCWSWLSWEIPSLIGIALADRIPAEWDLGFAGVLALLGLAYSTLSGRNSWVAALVAAAAAVAAFHLPLKLNIVVAIAAGVAAGMLLDRLWPDSAEARR
ncbi:MAG TPA: AzlC family ABC transporter permease [Gammaproteobacteria bacterium]|nr:AzlC family ABC transporter permease [Gammaproteobacteria bacterium]